MSLKRYSEVVASARTTGRLPLLIAMVAFALLLGVVLRAQAVHAPTMVPITTTITEEVAPTPAAIEPSVNPGSGGSAPVAKPTPIEAVPRVVNPDEQVRSACGPPITGVVRPECAAS